LRRVLVIILIIGEYRCWFCTFTVLAKILMGIPCIFSQVSFICLIFKRLYGRHQTLREVHCLQTRFFLKGVLSKPFMQYYCHGLQLLPNKIIHFFCKTTSRLNMIFYFFFFVFCNFITRLNNSVQSKTRFKIIVIIIIL
jgi:hypothetical protein